MENSDRDLYKKIKNIHSTISSYIGLCDSHNGEDIIYVWYEGSNYCLKCWDEYNKSKNINIHKSNCNKEEWDDHNKIYDIKDDFLKIKKSINRILN